MGWLDAVPKQESGVGKDRRTEEWPCSRREMYRRNGEAIPLPDLGPGEYLMGVLYDIGPVQPNPMGGELPLVWSELMPYAEVTGEIAESWEFRTLIRMSMAYISGKQIGTNPLGIMPLDDEGDES